MGTFSVQKVAKSPIFMSAQNEPPLSYVAVTSTHLTTIFQSSSGSWKLGCRCFELGTVGTVDIREMLSPAWKRRLVLLVGALPSTVPVGALWPGEVG